MQHEQDGACCAETCTTFELRVLSRPNEGSDYPAVALGRSMTPIIKVVGDFCNLRCNYCFYNTLDQNTPHVMEASLLEKFLGEHLDLFPGDAWFIWHGGEPTLAGLDFFRDVVRLQEKCRRPGQKIRNSIQTNAILINDDWASFFAENHFGVGVSIDGASASHDHHRRDAGGGASHSQVVRGVRKLQEHGINPAAIQTLTRSALPNLSEDFEFFASVLQLRRWGLNTYLDLEYLNRGMLDQSISPDELTAYLLNYIDRWLCSGIPTLDVREVENALAGALGVKTRNCTYNGTCTAFYSLEYDGRVFPCDRLSERPSLLLGDLSTENLRTILTGPQRREYVARVNRIHSDCAECRWRHVCHNGCTAHRVGGIDGKYYYCETRKAVFSRLHELVSCFKETRDGRSAEKRFGTA